MDSLDDLLLLVLHLHDRVKLQPERAVVVFSVHRCLLKTPRQLVVGQVQHDVLSSVCVCVCVYSGIYEEGTEKETVSKFMYMHTLVYFKPASKMPCIWKKLSV